MQGRNTHIDFILTLGFNEWGSHERHPVIPVYLVAECKRANPALNRWCFARAPYISRVDYSSRAFIVERIQTTVRAPMDLTEDQLQFRSGGSVLGQPAEFYQIGLVVKPEGQEPGDPSARHGRDVIEKAAAQACQGVNGMVEHLSKNKNLADAHTKGAILIPVVFTTARLFTTNVDIGSADILNGNVTIDETSLEEKSWICLQYPVSVGLKHALDSPRISSALSDVLNGEYIRSIPIVNAAGIDKFLQQFPAEFAPLTDFS